MKMVNKDEELIKEIEKGETFLIARDGFLNVVFNKNEHEIYFQFYEEKKFDDCRYNYIEGIKQVELYKSLKGLLNRDCYCFFNFEELMSNEMMGGYFHVRFKYLFIEYDFKRLYVVVK
jgi:hypothetical protein